MLYKIIIDENRCKAVCTMLERWRAWAERGGMNKEDLQEIRCMGHNFAWVCCLMRVLRLAGERKKSVIAVNMQKCAGVEEGATKLRP